MSRVQVYTKRFCPYCVRAKALLQKKSVAFEEIDVENDEGKREWLVEASGQRTVPQVFVDGRSLGGFTEIEALDRQGKLDAILLGDASRVG